MNDFIQQTEARLLNKYGVNTIDEVLTKQKQILEGNNDPRRMN